MKNKWAGDYLKIAGVSYSEGRLLVSFRDGDSISVEPRQIAPDDAKAFHWNGTSVGLSAVYLLVPGAGSPLEIPSEFLRKLSDESFARHSAKLAGKQARFIGRRLKELREKRGFTQSELARRAGIQQANLSRIENEKFEVATSTLWKLLAVMGYEPGDLSSRPALYETPRQRAR